jgi:hypothetical protein
MTTTTTTTLAVPTIHLNGTSRESLMEDLLGAYHALTEAIAALGRACPNGRDYYPQGNDALSGRRSGPEADPTCCGAAGPVDGTPRGCWKYFPLFAAERLYIVESISYPTLIETQQGAPRQ